MSVCPACGGTDLTVFYDNLSVPTNSCLLLDDAEEAVSFPRGELRLAHCSGCGFITNTAFSSSAAEYSARYEETQGYSPTFVDFGRDLAKRWVERYDLHGRHVLEIGCGKGEFLTWMVEAGAGRGTGIDPGVHPERLTGEAVGRIEWIADFYDASYGHIQADAIVCRHTLEHIGDVSGFLRTIAANLDDRPDVVVLFELPDALRVLEEVAFWDVYYEHCSYFTAGSLARLFRSCGFEILDLALDFDDQYLLIEARRSPAGETGGGRRFELEGDLARTETAVGAFRAGIETTRERWRTRLAAVRAGGGRTAVWGGGSKAVAFLTELGDAELVDAVVDINPFKHGRFIAGSPRAVVAPADLLEVAPDLVVVMNRIYLDEIATDLRGLGMSCSVEAV